MRHGRDGFHPRVGRAALVMGCALLLFSPAVEVLGQGLRLAVASPPPGVSALPGETVTIAWTGGRPDSRVDVSLVEETSRRNVSTVAIAIPNSGSTRWTLPAALRNEGLCGRLYQFHVQVVDRSHSDYGPAFTVACGESVAVDIQPDPDEPAVNPRSRDLLPVVIFTTPTFDATTVDLRTAELGPDAALPLESAFEDTDGDGDLDAVLQYWALETGIPCGATTAVLSGRTDSGRWIRGMDSIRTAGCH
jgi:hypothetical protein